jgi:DNA polymerase-1
MEKKTALLIDANALIHRAWHALPPMKAPDGRVVNAVYGFSSVLMRLLRPVPPSYVVACWDTPEPTFRHTAEPKYKAQRVEQPQEFYDQFPLTEECLQALGAKNVALPGYEADDLLGTLAARFAKEGVEVTILTSDKDALQLIAPHVRVMSFKKGVSETVIYDEETLPELFGLRAEQIADFKALRGDASDNLAGVPGIGEKTGMDLLKQYHSFEQIFAAAHDASSDLSPAVRRKLLDGEAAARHTLPLVQIMCDAPLKISLDKLAYEAPDDENLRKTLMHFGFQSLAKRWFGDADTVNKMNNKEEAVSSTEKKTKKKQVMQDSLSDVLDQAEKEKCLFLFAPKVLQGSLLGDAPDLVLGSESMTVVLSPVLLNDSANAQRLAEVLGRQEIKKMGHDLKRVWHMVNARGWRLAGCAFDTEIAAYLLSAGEGSYELEMIAASKLNIVLSVAGDTAQAIEALQVIRQLVPVLRQELEETKTLSVLERFEMPLISVLGAMEARGIKLDKPYLATLAHDFHIEKARLEKEMEALAGTAFNPASPSQLARVLFEVLNLPTKGLKRGKTGISTAASELEKLEGTHPIIEKIGEYREVAKLLSTYVDSLPALTDAEDRVHTTFNQTMASTGRLSSVNPNLQNIPIRTELGRKIRRAFVAAPGYVLLSCDYSQIELRVAAALSKDERMLQAFRDGVDIHTATAAAIWHVELEDVTKDQRRAAKAVNFGVLYGQGPHGLAKAAGIPFGEAREFIEMYFQVYAGVFRYLEETRELARRRGYVETLFGRRRPIPDINSPVPHIRAAAERMAINMPVQGTATGDIIKLALIALDREMSKVSAGARLLLQVHDEVVFEVPEDEDITKIARAVADIMEHVVDIGCPIVVEAKTGKNWEEMKKIDFSS